MNEKEKKLAEKIRSAVDNIWCAYYADENILQGDIEPHAAVQYEHLIDNIAEIIYKVSESNREVHMIKDLDAFEKEMQEKYPILRDICSDGIVNDENGKQEVYVAWLKFPYYSANSDGGFFSFYTKKGFEQYMTSSIRMFVEEEIKNEQFEIEQYNEFYNADHKPVFDCDKALYLYYKARMEMPKIKTEEQKMTSEEFNEYLDENLPKVKFEEPKVFMVTIEEQISKTFEVEALDMEEAMQLAEDRYRSGEYVLDGESNVSARLMSVEDEDGKSTDWVEF